MKAGNLAGAFGYAFTLLVVVPIIIWLMNLFVLAGNRVTNQQVQRYIDDSIHLQLKMPSYYDYIYVDGQKVAALDEKHKFYFSKMTRRNIGNYAMFLPSMNLFISNISR